MAYLKDLFWPAPFYIIYKIIFILERKLPRKDHIQVWAANSPDSYGTNFTQMMAYLKDLFWPATFYIIYTIIFHSGKKIATQRPHPGLRGK